MRIPVGRAASADFSGFVRRRFTADDEIGEAGLTDRIAVTTATQQRRPDDGFRLEHAQLPGCGRAVERGGQLGLVAVHKLQRGPLIA